MGSRRFGRRTWVTAAVVVLVLAGGTVGAVAATSGGDGPSYRTAAVTRGAVDQTLDATGTVEPVDEADLSFPVAGTVASVAVKGGQRVTAGQRLAQLSTTALSSQVDSTASTAASAAATLADDQTSQTSVGSTASTGSTGTGTVEGTAYVVAAAAPTGGLTADRNAVTKAQQTLLADQHTTDQDTAGATAALAEETTACRSFLGGLSSARQSALTSAAGIEPAALTTAVTPTPSATTAPPVSTPAPPPTTTTTTTGPTSAPTTPVAPPTVPDGSACQAAITQVLADQAAITKDQRTVSADETALDQAVETLAAAAGSGTGGTGTGTGGSGAGGTGTGGGSGGTGTGTGTGGTGSGTHPGAGTPGGTGTGTGTKGGAGTTRPGAGTTGGSGTGTRSGTGSGSGAGSGSGTGTRSGTGSGSGASSGRTTGPASADQIAADQAALDAAQAQHAAAVQALAQATLVSPLDGTVATVGLTAGQTVSAGSSTAQIVVLGPSSFQVTTTVNDTTVGKVKVGDPVTVSADAASAPLTGQVVAIGLLSTASSGGDAAYPVTIGLDDGGRRLFAGSAADVSIVLAHTASAVTVPSSAVRELGAFATVTVLRGGKATLTRVTLGAVGATRTVVASGLTVGERVVLANLRAPLPSSSATTVRGLGGAGGGGRAGGFAGRTAGG